MSLIVDIRKKLGSFCLRSALEAERGVTGILGPSGCGKSMTLKCIAGIERPDSGHIELDGTVLYDSERGIDLPPQQRRVGYLFQSYALFPNMTLMQNMLCGLRNRSDAKEPQREAMEMIAAMGLEGLEKHRPYQLSGGQQQRAALGRILINRPNLLMLDEPFSALDAYLRERLQRDMQEFIKDYDGPVLMVTHSRDEAYRLCGSIAVMEKGSLARPRKTAELFDDPRTLAAAKLTGCKNISRARRIGAHELYAEDWGISLTTAKELEESLSGVAVRSHDIRADEAQNRHRIACTDVIEDPFELTRLFFFAGHGNAENALWMKLPKEPESAAPAEIGIAPDKVLPLYGE